MMVNILRKHSPTKERLLDAAERLMLAKGFTATTVEEICASAKLTKGSFFHYFKSKGQLARELLERFCAASQRKMQEAVGHAERDPLKRVYRYIDVMIAMSKDCAEQGCLLGTFAQELSETNPNMRTLCDQAFNRWVNAFKADLDAAKAACASRVPIDTKSLAEHFIAILEGAKILAKAQADASVEGRSLRHFKRYLEYVFDPARG